MELEEERVHFTESNAVASAEQMRAQTEPKSLGSHSKRTSALEKSRTVWRRCTVHFEESDDEVLGVTTTKRIDADEDKAVEHGLTEAEAEVGPSGFSHQAGALRTDDTPIRSTTAQLSQNRNLFPPLFVSEGGDQFSPHQRSSYFTPFLYSPQNPPDMDGLNRARAIKASISSNISIMQPKDTPISTRRAAEDDPETQLIKTLREDQDMSWADITAFLNQERRNRSEAATFTPAAVYSRFVRGTPRIAAAVGEIGFDPRDYMHLRHPNQFAGANGTGGTSKAGKKRVKSFDNPKELDANVRKHLDEEEHKELETPERTEQLLQAVAKVERNFWVLVADEMERMTTKMYWPEELAGRYHAV